MNDPLKPEFKHATVRIFGGFTSGERRRIANQVDKAGNLVVTIRDDRIEVAFDNTETVYTLRPEECWE